MNSNTFFDTKEKDKWKGKSGIYVIEQPLFSKHLGYQVMKVGYASNSLYTRIADYRTAYGIIPFTIHAIYEISEKVVYKRARYALVCEAILHSTLKKQNAHVYGEWFKNLKLILSCVNQLKLNNLEGIKKAVNWNYYNSYKFKFLPVKLTHEDDVLPSAFLKHIISIDREHLSRTQSHEVMKSLENIKGVLVRNNESIKGTIGKYNPKYNVFKIVLENGEEIELSYKEIVKFVGMEKLEKPMETVKANKEKDVVVLRSGRSVLKHIS